MATQTGNPILDQALQALEREAGLPVAAAVLVPAGADRNYGATVRIGKTRLLAEIRKWAPHTSLGALIDRIKKLPERGILVADFVNPRMAEKLRAEDVQFIDTAGNAYINEPPHYIYIRGNRPDEAATGSLVRRKPDDSTGRAFATTGLKVVYAFLYNPELVNAPYRQIADIADAAVGTVGWVLNDLKAERYIADYGKQRGRRLVDYRRLLDKWTEAFPQKLRPKQLLGVFQAEAPDWWKGVDITAFDACWGGETAAAKLTNHLHPETATVYLRAGGLGKFVAANRLRKVVDRGLDPANAVCLLEKFWKTEDTKAELVDPVLVYAELIATADPRNRETAQIIFDEHIARRIAKP